MNDFEKYLEKYDKDYEPPKADPADKKYLDDPTPDDGLYHPWGRKLYAWS